MQSILPLYRQRILLILYVFCLSMVLLAPIASDDYMGDVLAIDFRNHAAITVQAKLALSEGQFPIKVAPQEHGGLRYPLFQFYSPLFFTISGSLYKWVTPNNPYVALKITLLLGLMLGGVFAYRCAKLISKSTPIAFLACTLYLFFPYLIAALHFRGACPELFGIGLIPVILYYTFCLFQEQYGLEHRLLLALAWMALALTHTITFFYTSFFLMLLLILYCVEKRQFNTLFKVFNGYLIGLLASLWFITPVFSVQPILLIKNLIFNPALFQALTPLSALLSFKAISPTPSPSPLFFLPNGTIYLFPIYASLGLPIITALFGAVTFISAKRLFEQRLKMACLFVVFFLAFLLLWVPFDIYSSLPQQFQVAQFSYRLQSQTQWVGFLIFILLMINHYPSGKIPRSTVVVLTAIIILSCGTWIHSHQTTKTPISDVVKDSSVGYGRGAYLINPGTIPVYAPNNNEIGSLLTNCTFIGKTVNCVFSPHPDKKTESFLIPILYYPGLLHVLVDNVPVNYFPAYDAQGNLVTFVEFSDQPHHIQATFIGNIMSNIISALTLLFIMITLLICYTKRGLVRWRKHEVK